ncbi:hypothetical protein TWF718_003959 [Orbilia javanica]|uniref:Prokaryotic-type class I peptide chain release factors domain-containing protein n=1 Tax=Orbilia javanica TaxID=47235 RepID=A0AAN8RPZ3_9PEZI
MACPNMLLSTYGTSLLFRSSRLRLCENAFTRSLNTTALLCKKQMPPRPKVDENEIEERFLKGSKVNKTSSAVQLRHIPTGIVVKSQETRSREQNRKKARELLAAKLEDLEKGEQSRNNIINEVKKKKKASKRKKSLRKYRKLDEAKTATAGQITAGDGATSIVAGELEAGEEDEEDDDVFEESDEEDDEEGDEDGEAGHGEGFEEDSHIMQGQGKKDVSNES